MRSASRRSARRSAISSARRTAAGSLVGGLAAPLDQPFGAADGLGGLGHARARRAGGRRRPRRGRASARAIDSPACSAARRRRPPSAAAASDAVISSSRRRRSSSTRSAPPAGAWDSSPVAQSSQRPGARDRDAAEVRRAGRSANPPPRRRPSRRSASAATAGVGVDVRQQPNGGALTSRPCPGRGPGARAPGCHQRGAAPFAGCVEQALPLAQRLPPPRRTAAGRARRPAPARSPGHVEDSASAAAPPGAAAAARRNWLTDGELGAGLGGAGARRLDCALGLPARRAGDLHLRPRQPRARTGAPLRPPAAVCARRVRARSSESRLSISSRRRAWRSVSSRPISRSSERIRSAGPRDSQAARVEPPSSSGGRGSRSSGSASVSLAAWRAASASSSSSSRSRRAPRSVAACPCSRTRSEPHRDPLRRRARGEQARLDLLALARLRRECLLGLLAPLGHLGSSRSASSRSERAARARCSAPASAARAARAASRRQRERASSDWRSRRSCSSAASAWRFSGRSRERASRSTSSARDEVLLACARA